MPKRKRSGKMTGKKRRYFRKSTFTRRRRRRTPLALKQHAFCERATTANALAIDTEGTAVGLFKSFSLNEMKQQAQYAQIFEFYRIDKIVATFRYKGGEAEVAGAQQNVSWNEVNPLLYFKVCLLYTSPSPRD